MFITISVDRSSTVYAVRSKSAWRPGPFGEVVAGRMVLNKLGMVVWKALESIGVLNPGVHVFGRVVMPDHVHFNVHLDAGLVEPLKVLGKAISRFKNHTIKQSKILSERCSDISTGSGRMGCLIPAEMCRPGVGEDGRAVRGLSWQQGYHDRLCLRREFIDATERYIAYNPLILTIADFRLYT